MRIELVGRERELSELKEKYHSKKSELVVLYGRRRVGKSSLIRYFIKYVTGEALSFEATSGRKGAISPKVATKKTVTRSSAALSFEGLESQETGVQIKHFVSRLKLQVGESLLQRAEFGSWAEVFDYLTTYIAAQREKVIISFDEYQWMAAGQSRLTSLVKYYWDNHWKHANCMLILCGSIASFMVKNVIRSKALYGRFSLQMHVNKLKADEVRKFFPKTKSSDEILRCLMTLGGVPKYLEEIDMRKSFEQNMEALFFREDALFLDEFEKVFNVHFKEPRNYLKIIQALQKKTLNLEELARCLKMKSSGGVKTYVENLMMAEFIRPVHSYIYGQSRFAKYKLADEFVHFYLHFVLPHKRIIQEGGGPSLFKGTLSKQLIPWMGFAFENYVMNNALYFAEKLGFSDKVVSYGPYFKKTEGVQVDLLYLRSDKTLSVCEMKFRDAPISTEIIPEMESKLKKLPIKRNCSIHKVLLAPNGISEALRNSEYFDDVLVAEDMLGVTG
jgi:AAA+ ATPase superfamily predicted ATPase